MLLFLALTNVCLPGFGFMDCCVRFTGSIAAEGNTQLIFRSYRDGKELRFVAQGLRAAACVSNAGVTWCRKDEEAQRAAVDFVFPGLHAELPWGAIPEVVIEKLIAAVEASHVTGVVNVEEYIA